MKPHSKIRKIFCLEGMIILCFWLFNFFLLNVQHETTPYLESCMAVAASQHLHPFYPNFTSAVLPSKLWTLVILFELRLPFGLPVISSTSKIGQWSCLPATVYLDVLEPYLNSAPLEEYLMSVISYSELSELIW